MNRRQFGSSGLAFVLAHLLGNATALATNRPTIENDIRLRGKFYILGLKPGEKWGVEAEDVEINGLSFPKWTWAWIGMALAEGVLAAIGAQLFNLLTGASSQQQGKSLEDLLHEQLLAFAKLVQETVDRAQVRQYAANMESYAHIYQLYLHTPTRRRLDALLDNTDTSLTNLAYLGFLGYQNYMSGTSLRLSLLQEARKHGYVKTEDFSDQIERSVKHHQSMIAYIDQQTEPSTYVPPGTQVEAFFDGPAREPTVNIYTQLPMNSTWFRAHHIKTNILGHDIQGWVPVKDDNKTAYTGAEILHLKSVLISHWGDSFVADRIVDFDGLRRQIKAEYTDKGQEMIGRWSGAQKRMTSKTA